MSFADAELTEDGFLGGRLRLLQPKAGYRAATDPVLLAAFVSALAGERVLDLGCGVGTALFCLMRRLGVRGYGIEIQGDYADLARRNAVANGFEATVFEGDATAMPSELRAMSFDHVMCNPPFYGRDGHSAPQDLGRDLAHRGDDLGAWMDAGLKRLVPGGSFTIIHRADALAEVLACFGSRLGGLRILPIAAREGREAGRILVTGSKGSKAALTLLAPLVMHSGKAHSRDGDDFTQRAREVLREGAALTSF